MPPEIVTTTPCLNEVVIIALYYKNYMHSKKVEIRANTQTLRSLNYEL
jgi:hypothetical protein